VTEIPSDAEVHAAIRAGGAEPITDEDLLNEPPIKFEIECPHCGKQIPLQMRMEQDEPDD
jgi:hypothetical protein